MRVKCPRCGMTVDAIDEYEVQEIREYGCYSCQEENLDEGGLDEEADEEEEL